MTTCTAVLRRRLPVWLIPALWNIALGLWGLSRQNSVWRDEAATWQAAQRPPGDICRMLKNIDAVHGLYYLLMHELFACFGPSTTTLRLPSVLAMAVAAGCVAVIGHRLAGAWAGTGGGMAFGLFPSVQFYLQEGRPYAMVTAAAGISTLLLVTMLEGRGGGIRWTAYAGTVLICGLLNWMSLLMVPAHLATLVWTRAGRGVWTRWVAASAAATAGVLPLILFSRGQAHQVAWIPPLTRQMLIAPAALLGVGSLGAVLDRPQAGRLSVAAVGLPLLAVPQAGLIGVSVVHPLFLDRYVVFSLLGLALLIGAGLDAAVQAARPRFPTASTWLVPAIIAATAVALLPQSLAERSPASRVDDVLAVAADVQRLKVTGDAVLFVPAWRRDTEYVSPDAFAGLRDIALAKGPKESGTLEGVEADPARIRTAMLAQRRILLVTDATTGPLSAEQDKTKMAVLKEYFTMMTDVQVRGRRVSVYERARPNVLLYGRG